MRCNKWVYIGIALKYTYIKQIYGGVYKTLIKRNFIYLYTDITQPIYIHVKCVTEGVKTYVYERGCKTLKKDCLSKA